MIGRHVLPAAAVAAAALLSHACEPDFEARAGSGDLAFSVDTLQFDTIVCGEVSAAVKLTLRNLGDDDLTIDRVALEGGGASPFGININGKTLPLVSGLRLRHADSLQIFLNVRSFVPTDGRPYTQLLDRVAAQSGATTVEAVIAAQVLNLQKVSKLTIDDDQVWTNDSIPYNIVDSVVVSSGGSLTLCAGVRALMSEGARLVVSGRLTLAGGETEDTRASLEPLRQGEFYDNVPGQWGGVELRPGARADLSNALIRGATTGLDCQTGAQLYANALYLRDAAHNGIRANEAEMTLINSIVANTGGAAIDLTGGTTTITHSTLAEYYIWDRRSQPTLKVHTPAEGQSFSLLVVNSIVSGQQYAEVEVDTLAAAGARFNHSFVRVDKEADLTKHPETFCECLTDDDVQFADLDEPDFHLQPTSPALGKADPAFATPIDMEGTPRTQAEPINPGALQATKEKKESP